MKTLEGMTGSAQLKLLRVYPRAEADNKTAAWNANRQMIPAFLLETNMVTILLATLFI